MRHQLVSIGLLLGGCSAASLALAGPAQAQSVPARSYSIPPQELAKALSAYAEQSGVDVIFTPDAVRGKRNEGLQGAYQPDAALERLLRGSGLVHRRGPSGNIIVEPMQEAGSSEKVGSAGSAPTDDESASDIVVTGTSIRGVAPVGSQLIQVDQRYIQDRGVQSTAALLATIPQFDSFGTRPVPGGAPKPTTPPSLRTLGPGATLSLLNSHRLVGVGTLATSSDPTSLPIAAIARVEVVADGASATYGSDAIAGVVNVILRKDLNGIDARASIGVADNYTQELYSVVGGKTWDTGSILLGVQYDRNSHLVADTRDYVTSNFTPFGGSDTRTFNAALPNVMVGGATYGFNGTVFNSAPNLADPAREADLIPASRKWNAILNGEQHIGDNLRLFGDAHYTNIRMVAHTSPASESLTFVLPSTNPFFRSPVAGQTQVAVQMGKRDLLGPYKDDHINVEEWGGSGGAEMDFSQKWSGRLMLNYGRSSTSVDTPGINDAAFSQAVASSDPATAYDPFTGKTSAATRARILDFVGIPGSKQKLFQITAALNGSLFALPGGDVKLAVGGEYRHEAYDGYGIDGLRSAPITSFSSSKRDVWSAYGELFVPVVGEDSNIPLVRRLELNGAVRHDHYSDFGSTTNPKFGVSWELVEGLKLRGSYGKSFHAPSLGDLNAIDDLAFFFPNFLYPGVFTPPGVTTPQNVILLAGGNASLRPEKATTWSVGTDINPAFAPRLRFSATYFNIRYSDIVVVPVGYAFLSPALTDLLVRFNPSEQLITDMTAGLSPRGNRFAAGTTNLIVDARRTNLAASRTKGIDFSLSYNFDIGKGKLLTDISGTHLLSKETQPAPGAPVFDDLATTATPAWRFRTHLGWQTERFRANVFWSHLSGFNNVNIAPVQRVSSFNPVDLNLSVKVPSTGIGKSFELQFDVQNLFDKAPPTVYSGNGISSLASPIGRLFQVSVKTEF